MTAPALSTDHSVLPVLTLNANTVPDSFPTITLSPNTSGDVSLRAPRSRSHWTLPDWGFSAWMSPGSRLTTNSRPSSKAGEAALSAPTLRFQFTLPDRASSE